MNKKGTLKNIKNFEQCVATPEIYKRDQYLIGATKSATCFCIFVVAKGKKYGKV